MSIITRKVQRYHHTEDNMKDNKKKLWVPKEDFRTRFAQRDLEISINEYNSLREKYLESQRKKEEEEKKRKKLLEEKEAEDRAKKEKLQKKAEDTLISSAYSANVTGTKNKQNKKQIDNTFDGFLSLQDLTDNRTQSINNFLNRKITSKKKDAPQEKKESYLDINIPSITSLVDDYTKPAIYNSTSGMFEIIDDPEETISYARKALLEKPFPERTNEYEDRYLRATDPVQRLKDVRNRYNILPDPVDVRESQDKKGAFWESIVAGLFNSPYTPGTGAAPYETASGSTGIKYNIGDERDKNYIDDVISTFSVGKNNAEFDAYIDAGIRLGEKKQYANVIQKYSDNLSDYISLQNQYNSPNVSGEQKTQLLVQMNNILAENEKIRPKVEEAVTYKYGTSVLSNVSKTLSDFFSENTPILAPFEVRTVLDFLQNTKAFSKLLPQDIGQQGKRLLDLTKQYKIRPGEAMSQQFIDDFGSIKESIDKKNRQFQDSADKQIVYDKQKAIENKQEALDWEAWHTPSAEFKAKEKAAQDNYLTSFDTYTHGMWGVLGSSASFNGVQMLSTGLNWLGAGLLMAPHPYAKAAGAVSTAAGAAAGIASGVYENRAEVTQNYISGLRKSLQERGLLKKFLEDGRKQLAEKNIEVRDDEDVFRHFILKDYKTNNPVIQDLALRHMFGSNNVFQNDMMAVSADVAFNAGLNVFGATGKVAEALKILPVGSKTAILRKVAENDLLSSAYHATAKYLKPNIVASALSPLANIPYNAAIKPALKATKSALRPMIAQAGKIMDRALAWSKIAPKSLFKAGTIGKYAIDFLGKQTARGYSEAIEEGKQYEYGKQFSEGKFAGKSNSMLSTLMDDLSTGLYTGLAFVGGQFFGVEPDKDLMANMRGGFLGGILNSGAMITAAQNTINAVGELKAGDIIFNNVMAEKLRQRSNIVNGEEMAKYASRTGYAQMMNAMDRAQSIHDHITQSEGEKVGLTQEELENQRHLFRRIAAIANSTEAQNRAKQLGIKKNSDRYRTFVSLINTADQMQVENVETFNDLVDQAKAILEKDGLSLNVMQLFDQAWNAASTDQQKDLVQKAKEFASWIQPINNQVAGQYNALNALINELQSRQEFLTASERRNLDHYIAQRDKLDKQVEDIRNKIGGTDNMQFLNDVPQDIIDKYTSIYRTMYQASAQLETSTVVLDNLWGKNDAKNMANDFVSEQLDFINGRIQKINSQKKNLSDKAKKSARDVAAMRFIEQYEKSVQDDIDLMAELADKFDKDSTDSNNKLNGAVQTEQEQPTDTEGVQGLPSDILKLAPAQATKFNIGDVVTNIADPDSKFEISDIKFNPSTKQFLIEAKTDNGDVHVINEDSVEQYQKLLPAPYHYETALQNNQPFSWLKFKNDSPISKAYEKAIQDRLPAIPDDSFKEYLQQLFDTVVVGEFEDPDSQFSMIDYISRTDMDYRTSMVTWHPLYGAIINIAPDVHVYVPSYKKLIPDMYEEFESGKKQRLAKVAELIQLRDEDKTKDIEKILDVYGVDKAYLNVLYDNAALNSIAQQILDKNSDRVHKWLSNYSFYTDPNTFHNSGINKILQPGEVMLSNQIIHDRTSSAYIDLVTIDQDGNIKVYFLSFSKDRITAEDVYKKKANQQLSIGEYYQELANYIYNTLEPFQQQRLSGVYIVPISGIVGDPIQVGIDSNINNFTTAYTYHSSIAEEYRSSLEDEIKQYILQNPVPQKPQKETDGTQEDVIEQIKNQIDELERVINDVYIGKLAFNGKIRSDARRYLETQRVVLTKNRSLLREMSRTDEIEGQINRIEEAYKQVVNILSAYKSNAVYEQEELQYDGETVNTNRPIIPINHPLSARSSSSLPVTTSSDFITNGKVEVVYGWLDENTGNITKLSGYSTYPGVGVYAIFTYDGVKYSPVLVQPSHYKNGIQPYTRDGSQFINDVIAMQNAANGLSVVVDAKRLLPTVVYKGENKPLLEIAALNLTVDDIQAITPQSDTVGITNTNNDVQHINKESDKSVLWSFKTTQSGSLFLFHTFNFKEYVDGGQIPIKLIPAKLHKSDVDVIISILLQNASNIATGVNGIMDQYYTINGVATPFKNKDVLSMLTTYQDVPDYNSMFWLDMLGRVYIKRRKSDIVVEPIDVLTTHGQSQLRELLSNGYELAQNKDILSANLGNPLDSLFGGLKRWISEHGNLVISKNLVFDEDDVNKNGTGFYGIGWSIKHGRLLSNVSSIYEPSISLSNPRIDDGTVSHKIEEHAEQEPDVVNNRPKPRSFGEDGGLLDAGASFGVDFYATDTIPEESLDEDEAREDIKRMLGDAAVEFVDDILCILNNGLKALGATLSNVIVLSKLAPKGTQFHESFHWILELLLDNKTRQRIYDAFSRLHPEIDSSNPRNITEGLAEDFRAYANKEKDSSKWARFWRRIWNFIKFMFNADKRVLYKLYRDSYRGKYKNIKPSQENIDRFNTVFATDFGSAALYHAVYDPSNGKTIELQHIPSDQDYRLVIDTIVDNIVSESGADIFGASVTKIDFSKERVEKLGKNGSVYKSLIGESNPDDINMMFRDVFDNWDNVLSDVTLSLKRFGLHFVHKKGTNQIETYKTDLSEEEQATVDNVTDPDSQSADIGQYTMEDYQISKLHKMSERSKYFFATIPAVRFVSEQDDEPMYIPETNAFGEQIDVQGRVIQTDPETGKRYIKTKLGGIIEEKDIKINLVRNVIPDVNRFGYHYFAPFTDTCKIALNRCNSANSLEELLQLFEDVAIEFPQFTIIAKRFASLINNFKRRDKNGYYITKSGEKYQRLDNGLYRRVIAERAIFGTSLYTVDELDFDINYNNQSMAVSIFNSISGARLHFFNIMSSRPSHSSIIFQKGDTDNGYSAKRYSQSWHSSFLANRNKCKTEEKLKKGVRVVVYKATNVNLFKDAAFDLSAIVEGYTNRRSTGWTTGIVTLKGGKKINIHKDPEKVKSEYIRILNSIGIRVDSTEFNHLLVSLFNKSDSNALMHYFQQDGEDFGRTKGVSIKKFVLAIQQGISENGEYSPIITSGSFYSNTGAVIQLADGVFSYYQSVSDLMQQAPGKNKYYAIANRNVQDIFIQDLNDPDSQMIRDLMSSPYHQGSMFLQDLAEGKIELRSGTHAGYKSDNKGDFGADFMKITNAEDITSKMTLLIEGDIVPPTLSNKKTYQPISVFDKRTHKQITLPGIKYTQNTQNIQTNQATAEVYRASGVPMLLPKTANQQFTIGDFNGQQFIVSEEVYNLLIDYAFSEYEQFKENLESRKNIPNGQKVVNFDTATKGAHNPGALRFPRFYEVWIPKQTKDGIDYEHVDFNLDDGTRTPEDNLKEAERVFFGPNITHEQRKAIITELISRNFDNNLKYFVKTGIIKYRPGWKNLPKYFRYEPVAIDTAHLNAILKQYDTFAPLYGINNMRSVATCAYLLDICLKHQIANEEYQRMFVGHPGLFVSLFSDEGHVVNDIGDISKRLGGHSSTGETQCRLDDVPTKYRRAELKDYKTTSSQYNELTEWFGESEARFTLLSAEQVNISIKSQKVRDRILDIAKNIKYKSYDEGYILDQYKDLFDEIDNPEVYTKLLQDASKSKKRDEYERAVQEIKIQIEDDKKRLMIQEYTRQSKLSLEQVRNELERKHMLTGVDTRIAAYSQNFSGKINVADGASFISPIMVKYMLQQIGQFTGKVAKAWDLLQGNDVLSPLKSAEQYKIITDALFGTQKYTATGYRMNNGFPTFYYIKSAFFPLFRQNAYGRTKDILDKMMEDNVHMLCFESAVKFGSEGKQDFPTSAEQLEKFHFNVVEEDFKYLRKQLNTSPKESDLMNIGSQTKKIALTILDPYKTDYITRDGNTEPGIAIRDRIFDCERKIAIEGFKNLIKKFKDPVEKSKYLKDNLGDRDADQTMLSGLQIVYEPGHEGDENYAKMRARLEALSNSEWIQSIITSLANKSIVDISLPGSAYIQRSVYAMEDNNILGDNQVHGIPKLHISNDWSSMDAVVSIDYFYQQFSFLEDMSFEDARDWLIKHKLIGKDAKADTVAYRIPTQANSSIHALRFVDVISTMRDTIILPEEFTAITGSDFDIDKLFLSTKHFRITDDDVVTTEFSKQDDPIKYYGNTLLECYLELLSQPKNLYANQLVRSIDYDISIPGEVVAKLRQGENTDKIAYDALQLYRQCLTKAENRIGGISVGVYALNNNSEILSMLFGVEYKNEGIVKALDTSRLYDRLDAEGNSVMSTIGAFITGSVDIAKDAWIAVPNINEYTYDLHVYLARAGFGLRALWFCSQPIIRKVSDVYIQAGGYLFNTNNKSVWQARKEAIDRFERTYILQDDGVSQNSWYAQMLKTVKAFGNAASDLKEIPSKRSQKMASSIENTIYVIQQIFGVNPDNPSEKIDTFTDKDGNVVAGTILEDIALHHNTEEDIFDPTQRYMIKMRTVGEDGSIKESSVPMSVKDIQFFVYLANVMLNDPVSDMKKFVQYAKIETKKQGKNRAEQLSYKMKYDDFFEKGNTKMMIPETVKNVAHSTSISTKMDLFYSAVEEMLGEELLEYSPAYNYYINDFIKETKCGNSADTIKAIINSLKSYQKYQFIRQYADRYDINIRDLFIGDNSIYNTLDIIKTNIIDYPQVYQDYTDGNGNITNSLLKKLQPSYIPAYVMKDYGKDIPKFVDFMFNQRDESSNKNDIESGWAHMLRDTRHPDIQQFARRLVVYAFMTSGDTNTYDGFFNLVPFQWREEDSVDEFGQSWIDFVDGLLGDCNNFDAEDFRLSAMKENDSVYVDILRNNWYEDDLVPTIQDVSRDDFGNTVNNYYAYTVDGEPLLIALIKNRVDEKGVRHYYEATTESPKLVIKTHNYDSHEYINPMDFKLYSFVRMGSLFNEEGELITFPIYGRISQTGGKMYGHTIFQYGETLGLSWENETLWYGSSVDDKLLEGMAQFKDFFDTQMTRYADFVAKGEVSNQELKEDIVKYMPEIPIVGSYEDGTPIEFTRSNAVQFYDMARAMANYALTTTKKQPPIDHNDSLKRIKRPSAPNEPEKYSMHSGGAPGSDSYWGKTAKEFGVVDVFHYYHGDITPENAPEGNTKISDQDYEDGKTEAAKAAAYNWGYSFPKMKDDRLVRNWAQVKYSDAIFAIGSIVEPGQPAFPNKPGDTRIAQHQMVAGGTGYAVTMAILNNKPVYVFDQNQEQWFMFKNGSFEPIEIPKLTMRFAGIGTRQINDAGKKAIRDIFENTFAKQEEESPKRYIDVWSTNRDRYANLSNVAVRPTEITPSISSVVNQEFPVGDIIKSIIGIAQQEDVSKFNSVEQIFQLIKFEAMKQFVRTRAEELYGLNRLQINTNNDTNAESIRGVIKAITDKQKKILHSTGSTITSVGHEMVPNVDNIITDFFEQKWNQGGVENVLNSTAYHIIREIMLQSFLQNPGATKRLLSTGDAIITHEKGSVYWKDAFPHALMSVRDEIRENYDNLVQFENSAITLLGGDQMAYQEYKLAIKAAKEGKMFGDVAPFFTPEEVEQIQQALPDMSFTTKAGTTRGQLIITSASRHTDPAFYATQIITTLRENAKKPFTDPTRINVLELWSKHDGIPIQNILEACKKYRVAPIVSFSISGLGGTTIEDGVMKPDDLLDRIEKLINVGILDPRVTTFRVDPILVGVTPVDTVRHIIERGAKMGIRKFVTSPMQTYSVQKDRNGKSRSVIPFIDAALKKDLNAQIKYGDAILEDGTYNWMKYYGLHRDQQRYPGSIAMIPKPEFVQPYINVMQELMSEYNIEIQSCAVGMKGLQPSACLDPEIIEAVTSLKTDPIIDATRPFCKCYGVHSDMFRYGDACFSSCSYCYGGHAVTSPFDYYDDQGNLKDFSYTNVNEYEMPTDEPVEVMIRDNKYIYNNGQVVDEAGQPVDAATQRKVTWKYAMDINKANFVKINGIYYVVTNAGIIFNWNEAKVENFNKGDKLRDEILKAAQSSYEHGRVSTVFSPQELKQLGESRKKFCKI